MAHGKDINALALAVILVAVLVLPARAAVSCSTAYTTLMPCLPYVQSGGAVAPACCSGLQTTVAFVRTASDRRSLCTCFKNVASGSAGGLYISRTAGLLARCHVQPPFKIDPNVNCSAVH